MVGNKNGDDDEEEEQEVEVEDEKDTKWEIGCTQTACTLLPFYQLEFVPSLSVLHRGHDLSMHFWSKRWANFVVISLRFCTTIHTHSLAKHVERKRTKRLTFEHGQRFYANSIYLSPRTIHDVYARCFQCVEIKFSAHHRRTCGTQTQWHHISFVMNSFARKCIPYKNRNGIARS